MLYRFFKVIMWATMHFYFRKIVFAGRKNIPEEEAAIMIANHSASFLDAMLLAVLMKRPLHFFARSDIFRKPWANKILRAFHMIPIYNVDHGKEDLKRNEETFAEGEVVLNNRQLLLIFPEGVSRVERIMLPLKKGTARVALQTASKKEFRIPFCVIPVGINYSAHRFRADIHIQVGERTEIQDYESAFTESPARAITTLTRELERKFSDTIIYVEQPERTDFINRVLELFRNDKIHALDHLRGAPIIQWEKQVCAKVSGMPADIFQGKKDLLASYDAALTANYFMDESVSGRYRFIIAHLVILIIGLPVFLISVILNALPIWFGKRIADKTVTRIDFYTSVAAAAGGFGYFLWWLLLIIAAIFIKNPWVWLLVLTAPVTLFLGMFWWEGFMSFLRHSRYLLAKHQGRPVVGELAELRKHLRFWD